MKLHFEVVPCGRCAGTDRDYSTVREVRCWLCRDRKTVFTDRGRTARAAYDELCRERVAVPATDLRPGDRIYAPAISIGKDTGREHRKMWRTIAHVSVTEILVAVVFDTEDRRWTYPLAGRDSRVLRARPDSREKTREIMREIARDFEGAWLDGEDPPARPEQEPGEAPVPAPAPVRKRISPPASGRQLALVASLAAGLEKGTEIRAEAENLLEDLNVRDASDLIDRLKAAAREQKKRAAATSRWAGPVGTEVTVTGTVETAFEIRSGKVLVIVRGTGEDAGITAKTFSDAGAARRLTAGEAVAVTGTVKKIGFGRSEEGRRGETEFMGAEFTPR